MHSLERQGILRYLRMHQEQQNAVEFYSHVPEDAPIVSQECKIKKIPLSMPPDKMPCAYMIVHGSLHYFPPPYSHKTSLCPPLPLTTR